ncbi:hypothetical protein [Rothia amarae]|uniref:hypothetical protein n=1 Tax=Rothia amarae TaxID=169480 RepID=UPI0033C54606
MAFKENSRIDTSRVTRSGGGRGVAVGGGIGGALLLLVVGVFFGQDGVNVLNSVTGAANGFSYDNVQGTEADEQFKQDCQTGADANSNSDCNMVATAYSLDNFWSTYLPENKNVDYV